MKEKIIENLRKSIITLAICFYTTDSEQLKKLEEIAQTMEDAIKFIEGDADA